MELEWDDGLAKCKAKVIVKNLGFVLGSIFNAYYIV